MNKEHKNYIYRISGNGIWDKMNCAEELWELLDMEIGTVEIKVSQGYESIHK